MIKIKDSGIEWLGAIPSYWKICKTLYILSMPITNGPHETPELYSDGIPFVSAEAVSCGNGKIDFNHIRGYISQDYYQECCKKYIPKKNDIYMIKSGATTGKVAVVDTEKIFTIWSPLAVFRVNENFYYKYLFYFLQSDSYQKQLELNWSYGTQQNIGMRVLEKLKICFPSLNEQKQIADYLDKKCSAIDSALDNAKKLVEKMREYKKSLITETVTKGLNPAAELVDSNIEWLGLIPSHWKIFRVKNLFSFGKGLPITKENLVKEGIAVISYGQIHSKNNSGTSVKDDLKRFVSESYLETNKSSLVNEFDFIFADTSEDMDGCGNCVYIDKQEKLFAGYHTIILRSLEKSDKKYLAYLFLTDAWRYQIRSRVSGIKVFSITQKILGQVSVILPPPDEQKKIADYLDEKCSKIDENISQRQKLIEKLIEYKKSLIYEIVTGKVEV